MSVLVLAITPVRIALTSNCVIKRLLGKMAGLIGGTEDLVVEDREVEGKSKANRMSGSKISSSDLGGRLVSFQRLVGRILALVANGKFGEVTVIVALPVIAISNVISPIIMDPVSRTSCGRRPLILQSWQTGSDAYRGLQGYRGKCQQARLRSSDGTP